MYHKDISQDNLNTRLPLALQPMRLPQVVAAEATATRVGWLFLPCPKPSESGIFSVETSLQQPPQALGLQTLPESAP